MIDKSNILSELIISKLQTTKVGLLIKSVDDISPESVITQVCNDPGVTKLYVSCIGYNSLSNRWSFYNM